MAGPNPSLKGLVFIIDRGVVRTIRKKYRHLDSRKMAVRLCLLAAWVWGPWKLLLRNLRPLCEVGIAPSKGRLPLKCPRKDQLGTPTGNKSMIL